MSYIFIISKFGEGEKRSSEKKVNNNIIMQTVGSHVLFGML